MKLRLIPSLLMFISSYFPLTLIFIIKDLDDVTLVPRHPVAAAVVGGMALTACIVVLVAARRIKSGVPVRIIKVSNKSGDMFSYTIPYMISFFNFNFGDWKTLTALAIFMTLLFALAHRTQSVFINPVLALAGYGLYDCQFRDGGRETHGLLISRFGLQFDDTCIIERLSNFLYFVTEIQKREEK